MGRGSSGAGGGSSGAGVTVAQNKTIDRLVKKTRDLKKEQYRIVNEDGDVVLEKKGSEHQVVSTVGEKREYMTGAVSIHNHPNGGTFSEADLRDFGFGARQMVVASPEGTYKLTNIKYGAIDQFDGWHAMQEAMEATGVTKERSFLEIRKQAQATPAVSRQMKDMQKTSEQWVKAKEGGKSQAVLDGLAAKYDKQETKYKSLLKQAERKIEVQPYHDFYRKNAKKYGFKYEFIRR